METTIDEVLVERRDGKLRAAALANGELIEFVAEPERQAGAIGSIHLGRVVRYVPALRAAFIEIGLEKPVMLDSDKPVEEGIVLPVQVIEGALGDKGARVARRLALEGRYVVLLPGGKGVAVSRRVGAEKVRRQLETMAGKVKPAGSALIVRSAAVGATEEALTADVARLQARWDAIDSVLKTVMPPACVFDAGDGLLRLLRRFTGTAWPRYVFDDASVARRAPRLAAAEFGDAPEIEAEANAGTLFDRHGIADILASAAEKVVPLKSGGRLIIEITAALTAADVDTGGADVLRTNLEAAAELGRQLRLRDLGGLIVADFGRMEQRGARDKVEAALARAVASDRVPVQLIGWTRAGMFEIVRPRARAAGSVE